MITESVATATSARSLDSVPQLLSVDDLVALVRGSSRGIWLREWIPELVAARVLVKRGRRFIGRPASIFAALMAHGGAK